MAIVFVDPCFLLLAPEAADVRTALVDLLARLRTEPPPAASPPGDSSSAS